MMSLFIIISAGSKLISVPRAYTSVSPLWTTPPSISSNNVLPYDLDGINAALIPSLSNAAVVLPPIAAIFICLPTYDPERSNPLKKESTPCGELNVIQSTAFTSVGGHSKETS